MKRKEAETRDRLLAAARTVFAENGPERATVRGICALARANVASVNYHFGGKSHLYAEVLRSHLEHKLLQHPHADGTTETAPPELRLLAFIRSLLARFQAEADPVSERLSQLLAQEFMAPSSQRSLNGLERILRPVHLALLGIVRELLPGAADTLVSRCAASIVGQCAMPGAASSMFARLGALGVPDLPDLYPDSQAQADFILDFTLGGLRRLDREQASVGLLPAGSASA